MKNRVYSGILAFILLLSLLSGCAATGETQDITKTDETDAGTSASAEASDATDDGSSQESLGDLTLAEQIVYNANGVVVTATGITVDSLWGTEIDLLIENSGTTDILVSQDNMVINGYMITGLLYAQVAAGKSSNETISISSSELESAGITSIATIDLYLSLLDPATYSTIDTAAAVSLKTSLAEGYVQTDDTKGEVLIDSDGIRVIAKYIGDDSIFGPSVVMYFENNTDKCILVQAENLSVNGYMVDNLLYTELLPGTKAVDGLTVFETSMEDNGIEAIENMEFTLSIMDFDSYATIFTSDTISLTAE